MNGLAHAENILWSHAENYSWSHAENYSLVSRRKLFLISRKGAKKRKEIFLKIKTSRNFAALREKKTISEW